jgi:mRNA interferase MazF
VRGATRKGGLYRDRSKGYSEATVSFEGKKSKAMADQLATVSKGRLFRLQLCVLSLSDMHKVEEAIKIQLDIH